MSEETTILYRPVGEKELALIVESGYRAFPPRLFWLPLFYNCGQPLNSPIAL